MEHDRIVAKAGIEAIAEAKRLREQAARYRLGLGPVIDQLNAERAAARRAIRAVIELLHGEKAPPQAED